MYQLLKMVGMLRTLQQWRHFRGNGRMIRLVTICFAAIGASVASAQQLPSYPGAQDGLQRVVRVDTERPSDAADVFVIWPGSGVPPGSEKWSWHEQQMQMPGSTTPNPMVRNVVIPTVTMFRPAAGTANGTALIVAPGGAFSFLMVDYERYAMARWLAKQGVTAFVLKYRVAHMPENDEDMPAFLQNFFRVLPHPGPTGGDSSRWH
jgi:acetyl esterase/lipase